MNGTLSDPDCRRRRKETLHHETFNAKPQGRKAAKFRIFFRAFAARFLVGSVPNPKLSHIRLASLRLRAFALHLNCGTWSLLTSSPTVPHDQNPLPGRTTDGLVRPMEVPNCGNNDIISSVKETLHREIFNAKTQGRKGAKFRIFSRAFAARFLVNSVPNPKLSHIRRASLRLRAFALHLNCGTWSLLP